MDIYSPGTSAEAALTRLITILKLLRGEDGCAWDRVQTHESIKQCVIEEAYEVLDAIERHDIDNLEEELGDLLLQVVFHAGIAEETGGFDMQSIANRVSNKLIRRHPHIFLKENAKTIDKVVEKWENVKRQERGELSHTDILNEIPRALPALIRSFKIQEKAADAGFDWEDESGALLKLNEELEEFIDAYNEGGGAERLTDEIGDMLFSVVNVARFLGIDPENALNSTSRKFISRFHYIEQTAAESGKKLEQMSLDEMDSLWELAKSCEGSLVSE
jgi:tetrapyrrole methylase family protein/MazG family protein